jgi:hypothetical protein
MLAKVGKSDGEATFTEARGIDGDAPKAATPVLPIGRGIKPALLFGEPVEQHV